MAPILISSDPYEAVPTSDGRLTNFIGYGGAGSEIDTDGSRAFIGCTPDNYVAVDDLKKLEVISKMMLGPHGLAWAVRH